MGSTTYPLKNNPEDVEDQMKTIILKFITESFYELQEDNDKWEMLIREREIKILQENLEYKDQVLGVLQKRCPIRTGGNLEAEAKPS